MRAAIIKELLHHHRMERRRRRRQKLPHVACASIFLCLMMTLPHKVQSRFHRPIPTTTTRTSERGRLWRSHQDRMILPSVRGGGGGFIRRQRQQHNKQQSQQSNKKNSKNRSLLPTKRQPGNPLAYFRTIDGVVVLAYFCNVLTMSLPVLLAPMAAADFAASSSSSSSSSASSQMASTVAQLSSTATLGGAVGKFLNGFICQAAVSRQYPRLCSPVYLLLLSLCTVAFAGCTNARQLARAYAAMEFCASMQWVALSVLLAEYYYYNTNNKGGSQQQQLAAALTALGLSSAVGQVVAKTVGAAVLAAHWPWRTVARWGAVVALGGAVSIATASMECSSSSSATARRRTTNAVQRFSLRSVWQTVWAVWGSPLFWILGFGHGMAFVTRGCDRILGPLYQAVAPDVSSAVAGGMTLAITLGLMRGLLVGSRVMQQAPSVADKKRHVARWYRNQVMAGLGLAVITWPTVLERLPSSSVVRATLVGLLSAMMASNVAYQFYQFPAMIAQSLFRDHAAVTIGFLDGCGFLLSTPIFAATSAIIPKYGWSAAWAMMAGLFAIAGVLMLYNIEPALEENS